MGYVCTWKLFQCYAERVADAGHIEGYYSLPTHVNCLLQRGLGQRLPAERFWNQTSLIPKQSICRPLWARCSFPSLLIKVVVELNAL